MNKYSLYDGTVELAFEPYRHKYTANGVPVTSVTSVLKTINKPAIGPWMLKMAGEYLQGHLTPGAYLDEVQIKGLIYGAKNAHKQRLETAGDIGTLGHDWAEKYVNGFNPPWPTNPELRNIAEATIKFVKEHDIRVIDTERKLYSKDLNVAGTADLIIMFEGELAIADWKTSSSIYNEVYGQLGAYSIAYFEETGQQAKAHVAINIRKDGDLLVGPSRSVAQNEQMFRDCLALTRSLELIEEERKQIVKKVA